MHSISLIKHGSVQLRNSTLVIKDGGSASVTVKIGDGNITWSEKRSYEYKPNRGSLSEVIQGDDVPLEVSFQFAWETVSLGTGSTFGESGTLAILAILRGGTGYTSSDADTCNPYSVDLELTITPPCASGTQKWTFPDFRPESIDGDVKSAQVSCSGKCNVVSPTVTSS